MKTYQIERREKGKWIHDSFYNDEQSAMEQARSLVSRKMYDGIRVVEDIFTEKSGRSSARYLYTHVDDKGIASKAKKPAPSSKPMPADPKPRAKQTASRSSDRSSVSIWMLVALLFVLLALGLASLEGIESYFAG